MDARWECLGQLGDVNPLDYGGYWVYRDTLGEYDDCVELLVLNEDAPRGQRYTIYRTDIPRCTSMNGFVSDNEFHPETPAWFGKPVDLRAIASCVGISVRKLIGGLCSADGLKRAMAYRAVGDYYGWENFDSYPIEASKTFCKTHFKGLLNV